MLTETEAYTGMMAYAATGAGLFYWGVLNLLKQPHLLMLDPLSRSYVQWCMLGAAVISGCFMFGSNLIHPLIGTSYKTQLVPLTAGALLMGVFHLVSRKGLYGFVTALLGLWSASFLLAGLLFFVLILKLN
ncbi:hypothetical protein GCM10008938_23380 [Deinococcus roseus]|uniref:Uncharacterized protein n=2 Tax=Deinococcus roseus TaxID=392414 RepID=A0ABQ2CZN4_9DEIO|nr:hypothetical protein GCM10008938_23380 [Deinococcus roseus]